jgi:hypothetical protein
MATPITMAIMSTPPAIPKIIISDKLLEGSFFGRSGIKAQS